MGVMKYLIGFLRDAVHKPAYEPEHEETVEHDTVMAMVDGKLVEVTDDDPEVRE